MKKNNILAILTSAAILASLCGCANNTEQAATATAAAETTTAATTNAEETTATTTTAESDAQGGEEDEEDEEDYTTGDASLDNVRNQDGIGEKELLVISFGTSFNDSRRLTIGAIENALEKAIPDYSVRRGFTANIVIDHVQRRDGILIDDIYASLDRAADNGVKTLVVQPTHLMNGIEYDEICAKLAEYSDAFEKIVVGEPLLTSDEDFKTVEKVITDWTKEYDDGETAICFMGHGTEHESNAVYPKLQEMLRADGFTNYYIGTVEAPPTLEDVVEAVKAGGYKRVVLEPLMVVAGDHANNDMAGDEDDSWKTMFENERLEVVCLIRGLGENETIQQIYVEHAKAAVAKAEVTPVSGKDLKDGTYAISVESSSSMFKIEECELMVSGGEMTAKMTMSGTGYKYLFPGKSENAEESGYIPFVEENGVHTFTVPVSALDVPINCAAFSAKKEEWYDRELVFRSDMIPQDAFADGFFVTAETLGLTDGEYTVEVTLGGGSGRAGVQSPAKLTVSNGKAFAEIVWSSKNYDYMVVGGEKILAENTDGNSTFVIPVSCFDRETAVKANTIAMSEPHEIDYTLKFDSSTIK